MSTETEDWESIDLTEENDDIKFAEELQEEEAGHTDTPRGCFAVMETDE